MTPLLFDQLAPPARIDAAPPKSADPVEDAAGSFEAHFRAPEPRSEAKEPTTRESQRANSTESSSTAAARESDPESARDTSEPPSGESRREEDEQQGPQDQHDGREGGEASRPATQDEEVAPTEEVAGLTDIAPAVAAENGLPAAATSAEAGVEAAHEAAPAGKNQTSTKRAADVAVSTTPAIATQPSGPSDLAVDGDAAAESAEPVDNFSEVSEKGEHKTQRIPAIDAVESVDRRTAAASQPQAAALGEGARGIAEGTGQGAHEKPPGDGKRESAAARSSRKEVTQGAANGSQASYAAVEASALEATASAAALDSIVDDSSVRGETREIKTAPAESRGESVAPAPSQGGGEAASAGAATSRFSQHLVTRGTKPPAEEGPHVREADQARFLNRVARAFQAAQDRGGEIRLRLSPPELGALKLEVKLQSGVLSAHIEADTPEARALLLDNLPQLRQRLAEQDIRVEQFDVDLADRQPGGAPDDPREGGRQQDESTRSAQRRGDQPAGGEETLAATAARFRAGSNQLNVIV